MPRANAGYETTEIAEGECCGRPLALGLDIQLPDVLARGWREWRGGTSSRTAEHRDCDQAFSQQRVPHAAERSRYWSGIVTQVPVSTGADSTRSGTREPR